jgi:hypothetical protein
MPLPFPTLDHVVINALDRMDAAAECYRRLGFTLTPRGRHTLGSINHLAVFGTDYLELVGVAPDAPKARADIRRFPAGLNGFVFGTEDPDTLYAALAASGVPAEAPIAFSRPVELPRGSEDARFRVVRLAAEAVPYGRLYFCNHLTRRLVWRDAWREHANGAVGMVRVVVCAAEPEDCAGLLRAMFGPAMLHRIAGGFRLAVGLSHLDILAPAALAAEFGDALPDADGRRQYMAALTLRTLSLARAAAALQAGGIAPAQSSANRLVVPAAAAFGATLEFAA